MRLRLCASSHSFSYNPETSVAVWLKLMERVVAGWVCGGWRERSAAPGNAELSVLNAFCNMRGGLGD